MLSSQIEGTQSSLSDLVLFEAQGAPGVPVDDVQEVSRYVAALQRGLQLLAEGLPRMDRNVCCAMGRAGQGVAGMNLTTERRNSLSQTQSAQDSGSCADTHTAGRRAVFF